MRTRADSRLGGALIVAVCIALGQAATYLLNLVSARHLGPARFGELASLLGVLAIGNVVALAVQAVVARRVVAAGPTSAAGVGQTALRLAVVFGVAAGPALARHGARGVGPEVG